MSTTFHRDPQSAWQHLCAFGGLELDGRDEGLDERILSRLDSGAHSLEQALSATDMASFIRAFFEALHPYVAMYRDILDFFEHAGATLGESQWTLQVDDIDLNLEHFRKWLAIWDDVTKTAITVPAIDAKAMWQLWSVLQERQAVRDQIKSLFQNKPLSISSDARQWASAYNEGTFLPWPKSLCPSQGPPELAKSALIALTVLQRLLDQRLTPAALKERYYLHQHDICARGDHNNCDPSDGFDFWTIAQNETDHWLRSFVVALSAASQLPKSEMTALGKDLDAITDRFHIRPVQINMTVGTLESVLSLPVWKKRFDLYSVWIATEIIRALKRHDVEIHHDHGRIAFAFKETILATIHSSPGPFKIISERRIPLENPRGEGRKGGVQPDHGIWTMKDGREVCKMVIEVKHYKNSSQAKFVDVFEDYARALPDGNIYLVNHGPVGAAVNRLSRTIRNRCNAIGHLTSSNRESREELESAVRQCVGEPMPLCPATTQSLTPSKVLLVDVSGSMNTTMRSAAMHSFIRLLAEKELPTKLVAADQKIIGVWDTDEAGFEKLLLSGGGLTELSQPITDLLKRHEAVLLITDEDGAATIRGFDVTWHEAQDVAPRGIEVRLCRKR